MSSGVMLSALAVAALVTLWGMRCLAPHPYPIRLWMYWSGYAMLAVLAALAAPQSSYLFLVPAAVAALSIFSLRPEEADSRGWRATAVTALPLVATAIVWLPLAIGFRDALHVIAMPFISFACVPVFGGLIPVMPLRGRGWRRIGGLLVVLFAAGLFV
jgi:hypothetical protein